jgi:hypothetical protein
VSSATAGIASIARILAKTSILVNARTEEPRWEPVDGVLAFAGREELSGYVRSEIGTSECEASSDLYS